MADLFWLAKAQIRRKSDAWRRKTMDRAFAKNTLLGGHDPAL